MKIVGIIVEYNPLHYGHIHHIEETKKASKADVLIAVMSTHLMQRGEFSVVDKFTKTTWALKSGIDLVIELPGVFSIQSAEYFARTSVSMLHALGVEDIYFGSETGDVKPLYDVAETLDSKEYNAWVKFFLDEGKSYPSSSSEALKKLGFTDVHTTPNNILGIQYIRAGKQLSPPVKLHAIQRIKTNYYDEIDQNTHVQSATAIRNLHQNNDDYSQYVPSYVFESLNAIKIPTWDEFFPYFMYKLKSTSIPDLKKLHGFEEGLEYRFKQVLSASNTDDFIDQVISSRYTHAKIKRTMMALLVNLKSGDLKSYDIPYIRVLGMNQNGQRYLNIIKKDFPIPLVTKLKKTRHNYLNIELKITEIYDLIYRQNLLEKEFKHVIIL